MSEAFDQAVADIAAKYNTSSENVTRIASRNPALASFDPDNAAAWTPTDTITDNVGMGGGSLPSTGERPSLSGRGPGVSVLSDELLATLREGFLKAGEKPVRRWHKDVRYRVDGDAEQHFAPQRGRRLV